MYDEFINNILETRGRHGCGDEYFETHHIIPKCLDGTNDEENLIDLFAREHFEAHRLLALENPNNEKLTYAWWMMATIKNEYQERCRINAEEYEEAKITILEPVLCMLVLRSNGFNAQVVSTALMKFLTLSSLR